MMMLTIQMMPLLLIAAMAFVPTINGNGVAAGESNKSDAKMPKSGFAFGPKNEGEMRGGFEAKRGNGGDGTPKSVAEFDKEAEELRQVLVKGRAFIWTMAGQYREEQRKMRETMGKMENNKEYSGMAKGLAEAANKSQREREQLKPIIEEGKRKAKGQGGPKDVAKRLEDFIAFVENSASTAKGEGAANPNLLEEGGKLAKSLMEGSKQMKEMDGDIGKLLGQWQKVAQMDQEHGRLLRNRVELEKKLAGVAKGILDRGERIHQLGGQFAAPMACAIGVLGDLVMAKKFGGGAETGQKVGEANEKCRREWSELHKKVGDFRQTGHQLPVQMYVALSNMQIAIKFVDDWKNAEMAREQAEKLGEEEAQKYLTEERQKKMDIFVGVQFTGQNTGGGGGGGGQQQPQQPKMPSENKIQAKSGAARK